MALKFRGPWAVAGIVSVCQETQENEPENFQGQSVEMSGHGQGLETGEESLGERRSIMRLGMQPRFKSLPRMLDP